jgi:uncharacterized delta-60 repeat protein
MSSMKRIQATSVFLVVLTLLGTLVACQEADLPLPSITTISPDTGPVGTEITVIGSNLGESIEQVKILFGATPGITVAVNATRVLVKVPTLNPGTYSLGAELGGRQSKASFKFTVLEKSAVAPTDPFELLAPGTLDPTFENAGVIVSEVFQVGTFSGTNYPPDWLSQPDGKFVVVAVASGGFEISRFNTDGRRDIAFGLNGISKLQDRIGIFGNDQGYPTLRRSSTGKYIVTVQALATSYPYIQTWMINADGSLDQNFGLNGTISVSDGGNKKSFFDAAPLPDGRVIVIGQSETQTFIRRYLASGLIDNSFGVNGEKGISPKKSIEFIQNLSDGNLIVYGREYPKVSDIIKFNPDGVLDNSFRFDGYRLFGPINVSGRSAHYVIERSGNIYVVGDGGTIDRVLPNGSWDSDFQIKTKMKVEDCIFGPDGSVILFGSGPSIERYDSRGIPDTKFGSTGSVNIPVGEKVLTGTVSGNKLTIYGSLSSGPNGNTKLFAARIKY